jgi:hypothetical protein
MDLIIVGKKLLKEQALGWSVFDSQIQISTHEPDVKILHKTEEPSARITAGLLQAFPG